MNAENRPDAPTSNPGSKPVVADHLTRDGITIYKRYTGPDAVYYTRFRVQGKKRTFSLCATAEESFTEARKLKRATRDKRFEVLNQVKQRVATSTLEEIFTRYELGAQAACSTSTGTIASNLNAVRNILRTVRETPAATKEQLGKLPSTAFSAATLERFKQLRLAAVPNVNGSQDKIAFGRACITINSTIRQARSLYNQKLPDDFYKGLVLPDVAAIRKVRLLEEPAKGFKMPAPQVLANIREQAPLLKQTDPNGYAIYLLALGCGLRPGEIKFARKHWIEHHTDGRYVIRVQLEADFNIKDNEERLVPIEDDTYEKLRDIFTPDCEYILRGNPAERTDHSFRRFSAWLKHCGLDRIKAAHELRKIFGSLVTQQAGLRAAQELLGHSSYATTEKYYAGQVDLPKVTIFG